jgi:galactosyl transferase GMA12/MNN10 family
MIMQPQLKDAVIIQQAWQIGPFADMLRLTYQRHAAYAWAHGMEYWTVAGCLKPEMWPGGWGKIWLIQQMMDIGYKYIYWIDTDAAIVNMDCDLRDALPDGKLIGACEHWADWFAQFDIPKHYNIGVCFFKNEPQTKEFLAEWIAAYPGDPRWMEQGTFNELVTGKYKDIFHPMDAEWNATFRVNEVERPNIQGWHGVMPEAKRFAMMKEVFKDDPLRFRV